MTKYIKKPIPIDAFRWDGKLSTLQKNVGEDFYNYFSVGDMLLIKTLEGVEKCKVGNMIARGVDGEYYPIDHDIFLKTYERAK